MRVTVATALAVGFILSFAGCTDVVVQDSPKLVGTVIDDETGAPIIRAHMGIAPRNSDERISVETTPGGRFYIPPMESKISVWIFESVQPDTEIVIWADGYEGQTFHTLDFPPDGVIRLKKR